jgi:polysaccharide biosynthesis transport protein
MSNFALPPDDRPKDGAIDVLTMFNALLRRWKLIITVPLFLLIGTYALLKVVPAIYQSYAEILIFDPQRHIEGPIGQQQASERDFDTVAINTEIEVLKSASLSLRVAEEIRLDENPEFRPHSLLPLGLAQLGLIGKGWVATRLREVFDVLGFANLDGSEGGGQNSGDSAEARAKRIEAAAAILRNQLSVDRVPFSYVLGVSVASRSPEMAQRLAAKVVDDYLAGQREGRRTALQELALWLKDQLSELKSRIIETETSIEKLKAQSGLGDTGKGNVNEQQVADLNAQLTIVQADVAQKRAQLEQARQISNDKGALQDLPEAITSPLIGQLRLQQSELLRRQSVLRDRLGDRHAEVLSVDAQLAGINKALSDEAAHILGDLQNSYEIALRREESLEASLHRLTEAQSNSGDYVKLQQLQRIAAADSKLYETYLSQYNEIGTRETLQISGARIITPATLPTAPNFPRRKLWYMGAGSVGIAVGVLLAFLAELLQPGVEPGVEAEQVFGYPVVGVLPLMRRRRSSRGAASRSMVHTIVGAPLSPLSEAVRTIRLGVSLPHLGQTPMVILVTSCLPGEGKSSVAMLLAASSAGAGQRTALVDCDLRGRTISREFGEQQSGLTDLLTGIGDIATVAVHDPATGCDVIPAGSSTRNPGDLVASPRMGEVITRLREHYDYVVLDTPPLLSVIDTIALATIADKILVTIDNSRTSSASIVQAFRLLRPKADRVAGMVLNKVDPKQLGRYGYGGYHYADLGP